MELSLVWDLLKRRCISPHKKKTARPAAFLIKKGPLRYFAEQSLSSLSNSADTAFPSLD